MVTNDWYWRETLDAMLLQNLVWSIAKPVQKRSILYELNKNPSKYICDFALHHTYESIWRACMGMASCSRCLHQGHLIPNDALLQHGLTHHTLIIVCETFTAAILNLASYAYVTIIAPFISLRETLNAPSHDTGDSTLAHLCHTFPCYSIKSYTTELVSQLAQLYKI